MNQENDCWILNDNFKDVLPFFFINLELNDLKNIRLICRKFRQIIDDNSYGKLFNLIFQLKINNKKKAQMMRKIIKQHPIIKSFIMINQTSIDDIPNDTKELHLIQDIILRDHDFPLSLKSLYLKNCNLTLRSLNSIPSSLSFLHLINTNFFDEKLIHIPIKEFPLNLKRYYISCLNGTELKIWPPNLINLRLSNIFISSKEILDLSKLSSLVYLELNKMDSEINTIDLSNFIYLNGLTYRPNSIDQQISFPLSLLQNLKLCDCNNSNIKSTKLPNSLIHLKIDNNLNLEFFLPFLLKKENKLPLLQSFKIRLGYSPIIIQDIPKILQQYDKLKLLIFPTISWNNKYIFNIEEKIKQLFSYLPPNLSEIRIHQCPREYISYIEKLFPNVRYYLNTKRKKIGYSVVLKFNKYF